MLETVKACNTLPQNPPQSGSVEHLANSTPAGSLWLGTRRLPPPPHSVRLRAGKQPQAGFLPYVQRLVGLSSLLCLWTTLQASKGLTLKLLWLGTASEPSHHPLGKATSALSSWDNLCGIPAQWLSLTKHLASAEEGPPLSSTLSWVSVFPEPLWGSRCCGWRQGCSVKARTCPQELMVLTGSCDLLACVGAHQWPSL